MGKIALLMDVMSIQQYVFSSNTLVDNLGASYIVEHLFDDCYKLFDPEMINDGGGNVLMIFKENTTEDSVKNKVKDFTRSMLSDYPGLTLAAAIINDFEENNYAESMSKLHKVLQKNKNWELPNTMFPLHGITAECATTGHGVEEYDTNKKEWISSSIAVKRKKTKGSNDDIKKLIAINSGYCFTDRLDYLGQSHGDDSHIAVVHIDGNDMGERFRNIDSFEEFNTLSKSLKQAVENSTKSAIDSFIADYESNKIDNEEIELQVNGRKKILPIRPIILGGDDITFVSEGRLGIYFAIKFMEAFAEQKDINGNDINLSACAGVSIVKTKYPFYRANQLAVELCSYAKKVRREKNGNGSYLDFHFSYGGLGNSLDEIRKKHFINNAGAWTIARPYKMEEYKGLLTSVNNLKEIPNSDLKELREILYAPESSHELFLNQLRFRGKKLPEVLTYKYDKQLFNDEQNSGRPRRITHLLDLIELSETIYPA